MHVCIYPSVHVCVHMEARGQPQVSPSGTGTTFFEAGPLTGLELTN